MCGRYSLAVRPSQVRQMLQDDDMPVWDAPADEGDGAPRQTYNFAPGNHGIVYRADVPDWGAGPRREHGSSPSKAKKRKTGDNDTTAAAAVTADEPEPQQPQEEEEEVEPTATGFGTAGAGAGADHEARYKLQSMKWGLIPFWTKRSPDYGSMLKTINCRDDSLAGSGGMWSSMKARKRCVVVAQGFYEWLRTGPKEKVPHFVKRKDGRLMCFAGLWDCVQYEDDDQKLYTYTIITTSSNKQLGFLHDRMPVILDQGSDALRVWLDPSRHEWSNELQALLKPYSGESELEVYPVSKEVGKVGNNSPSFIVPIASRENKSNIANFFANAKAKKEGGGGGSGGGEVKVKPEVEVKKGDAAAQDDTKTLSVGQVSKAADDGAMTNPSGIKRQAEPSHDTDEQQQQQQQQQSPTKKKKKTQVSPSKSPVTLSPSKPQGRAKISATSNGGRSPVKGGKQDGSQKITKFFANSAA